MREGSDNNHMDSFMAEDRPFKSFIGEHPVHSLGRELEWFQRILDRSGKKIFESVDFEDLKLLEKGLKETLAEIQAELGNDAENRKKKSTIKALKDALSKDDLSKATEILERGVQVDPGSETHASLWVYGQLKRCYETERPLIEAKRSLLEKHGLGVPSDPAAAKAFVANVIPHLNHFYQEVGPVADAIAAHGADDRLVTSFAAKCVEQNDFQSFDKVAHFVDKHKLPLEALPAEGMTALVQRDIRIPNQELFEEAAVQMLSKGNFDEVKEGLKLKLNDGGSMDFPQSIRSPYAVNYIYRLPPACLKELVPLGMDQKIQVMAANEVVSRNDYHNLRGLLENKIIDPNIIIGTQNTLAHVLAKSPRYNVELDGVGSDVKTLQVLTEFGVDLAAKNDEGKTASECVSRSRKKLLSAFHAAEAQQMLASEVKPTAGTKLQAP